jgi:nitric oxide reductase NorQ protein
VCRSRAFLVERFTLQHPPQAVERRILVAQADIDQETAEDLVRLAQRIRRSSDLALREVASTRTLIAAARLIEAGVRGRRAAHAAIVEPLSDELETAEALIGLINTYLVEASTPNERRSQSWLLRWT